MAYSYQRATSDGTMAFVDISIDYLDRSEITVYFDDVLTTDWTWSGTEDKRILFSPNVPNGVVVMVKRITDASALRHKFSQGAAFTAVTLDEDLRQALHMAQEASEANLVGDFFTDVNMHGFRLVNIGTAVDDSDALTLAQYKADALGASAAKDAAEAAEATAVAAAASAVAAAAQSDTPNLPAAATLSTAGAELLRLHQGGFVKVALSGVADWLIGVYKGFTLSGGGVARTLLSKLRERVSVFDFLTEAQQADVVARTFTLDLATPLNAAIAYAQANKYKLHWPAGGYRINSTLTMTDEVVFDTAGKNVVTLRLYTASTSTPALLVDVPNNSSFIGGRIGGMTIECNGGAARGIGLRVQTTATNSAVSQSIFEELFILNCNVGVSMTGVIYMSTFRNITVSGGVGAYGWFVTSAQEVIYNSFTDLEVTNVENGAYAYYFQVLATQFRNLTADGVVYFSNPYGCVKGLYIEGIYCATPVSTTVVQLNQCDALEDVAIINCPTAKTNIAISVAGRCNIRNVRWPDSGAGNQPAQPLLLSGGSRGTVDGYQTARAVTNKVEAGSAAADLNNWVFSACADITDWEFRYQQSTWTPTFPSGWTTAPTVISAQYTRVGRQVTVTMYAQDGVATAGATIGGLPVAANATQGAAMFGCSSDTADVLRGSVTPGASQINNIPAVTLTGNFWQIVATYFT